MKLNYKNIYTTILSGILVGIITLTFGGCNEENRYPGVDGRYPVKNEAISDNSSDFVLIKKQTFYDESAYGDVRNVYILKETIFLISFFFVSIVLFFDFLNFQFQLSIF